MDRSGSHGKLALVAEVRGGGRRRTRMQAVRAVSQFHCQFDETRLSRITPITIKARQRTRAGDDPYRKGAMLAGWPRRHR